VEPKFPLTVVVLPKPLLGRTSWQSSSTKCCCLPAWARSSRAPHTPSPCSANKKECANAPGPRVAADRGAFYCSLTSARGRAPLGVLRAERAGRSGESLLEESPQWLTLLDEFWRSGRPPGRGAAMIRLAELAASPFRLAARLSRSFSCPLLPESNRPAEFVSPS
jgi:hypothetical protein